MAARKPTTTTQPTKAATPVKPKKESESQMTNGDEVMPAVIEWSEPPVIIRGQRRSKYQGIIDALMAHPGQWALVMEGANPASAKVFTNHGCEITTRADGNGRVNVWAMYPENGDDEGEYDDTEPTDETDEVGEDDESDEDEGDDVDVESRPIRKRPVKRIAARN